MPVICQAGANEEKPTHLNLIPLPVKVESKTGVFKLRSSTRLISDEAYREIAELFAAMIKKPTGYSLVRSGHGKDGIHFNINRTYNKLIGEEGYVLDVKPYGVSIQANKPAGLFYGIQTLMQLLPGAIESSGKTANKNWDIPCVKITDYPRFGWRGLMLDVSRHFFPKELVKKYINQLAKYKMNVFHWHLTDDQGWRIEIKSLPKLTSIGAWRAPRMGLWWSRKPQGADEVASYGGYYTQEEVKEIVAYASKRFVTILPEIDVPGHSLAALTAYPELSCTGGPFSVNVGNNFPDKKENALCPGNEQSFEFMDKVIGEVAALFPGRYIHIGGDECDKAVWKDCPKCKKRMEVEKLKTVEELQSYFIKRMEKMVQAKGKKLMGWDEILEGGLAPEATVMSWRGMKGGIDAAKMNHHVVMTPTDNCYLDLYQGDPAVEPPTYSMLTLRNCYNFDPVPKEVLNPALILGGQGCLWTESVPSYRHAEYMTWPRAFALAEALWSPKEQKNWENFILRMEGNMVRYDFSNINYARSIYDPVIRPVKDSVNKTFQIALDTELKNLDVYYTFDGTYPDKFSAAYKAPLSIPTGADLFRVLTYRNGKMVGRMISVNIKELEKRLEK
ncbi:family 20 glycosylhydrolase [Pedobacter steynii]|nr:family 20 glycosylhydrolase [Pedobacter steynii]